MVEETISRFNWTWSVHEWEGKWPRRRPLSPMERKRCC